jgi:lipopolysaccharide transport system ATP-binding protein
MSNVVIKIENLSKQYRLGLVSTRTMSHDLNRWYLMNIRGKDDPYLKIGETNDRSTKGKSEYVWALRDINLEVQQGEVLGIIGKNGAGKSTLLKILSKVTTPSTGSIRARGRIASLLEVGTGFHPEMTGRENIFMNGAILGMTKAEIQNKLDEIVDFSGIERYIDTPVKRYSSGMMVRLGFAVAAYLEPEILVVDEVLAVGDAEFQKKALGKMQDISSKHGRTVLFVSHNLGSINQLCSQTIVLNNGFLTYRGLSSIAIDKYLSTNISGSNKIYKESIINEQNQFKTFINVDINNAERSDFKFDEKIGLYIELYLPEWNQNLELAISLQDKLKKRIFTIHEPLMRYYKGEKIMKFHLSIPSLFITPGKYSWISCINFPGNKLYDLNEDIASFSISETGSQFSRYEGSDFGYVFANYEINSIS